MSYPLVHHETRETPAEYGESNNPAECYNCQEEVDLDDDDVITVDSPLGDIHVHCFTNSHWNGKEFVRWPVVMCGCGECEIPLRQRVGGAWETGDGVIVKDGRLWVADCETETEA